MRQLKTNRFKFNFTLAAKNRAEIHKSYLISSTQLEKRGKWILKQGTKKYCRHQINKSYVLSLFASQLKQRKMKSNKNKPNNSV